MLLAVCFLALVASVPATGKEIGRLAEHRFKAAWLLAFAFVIQVGLTTGLLGLQGGGAAIAHIASYALGFAFLGANRALAGLWVVALGGAANLVAIVANHGVMPATHSAMATAGKLSTSAEFVNSAVLSDPKLLFLGDVFALPESMFFANVFSAGDVLIVIGVGMLLHQLCGRAGSSTQPVSSSAADSNTSEWTSTSAAVV
ncbi:MAG TPA: DUF5317 domain-containing protein [Actinomycetota bacterium]|nr:DUF5317 domain-containing protein [Actinomycetota bacterium]